MFRNSFWNSTVQNDLNIFFSIPGEGEVHSVHDDLQAIWNAFQGSGVRCRVRSLSLVLLYPDRVSIQPYPLLFQPQDD